MYDKKIEFLKPKEVAYATLDPEQNKKIVETAGFIPLDVKFKRFEQNGIVAQFNASEFTSSDYRQMYSNPDFDITPEDDMEEVFEKIEMRNQFIQELQKQKTSELRSNSKVAPQAPQQKIQSETVEEDESE